MFTEYKECFVETRLMKLKQIAKLNKRILENNQNNHFKNAKSSSIDRFI